MKEEKIKDKLLSVGASGTTIPSITEDLEYMLSKPVPNTYKLGREGMLQLSKIERDLFTDIEEKESGNYIVSGLSQSITELDLSAFSFAVGQILYNQSYQSGHLDENSGLDTLESQIGGFFMGDIITTRNELCRLAYGKRTTENLKKIAETVDVLHSTPVKITYPNGDEKDAYLCTKQYVEKRAKDGAIMYHLHLNPIYTHDVKSNFAELPQDFTQRLSDKVKKLTAAHYKLSRLLSCQDKRKPFYRNIEQLITDLGLTEQYKKDKSRAEKKLVALFDDMVKIGILTSYELKHADRRGRKYIAKIVFILNEELNRSKKEIEEKKEEVES